jgi:DNA-binding transcriptional LysR family regulator
MQERNLTRAGRRIGLLSIVLMLVGSDRLAVVPRRVANDLERICPLIVRELPFASPRIALSMIWHRRLDNHDAQRWLRDMVKASTQS